MAATKTDLKKELAECYAATTVPAIVEVPELGFLMIDGAGEPGEPGGPAFTEAIGALYGAAYSAKFALKTAGSDHVVMPLEALWTSPGEESVDLDHPGDWEWTVMMAQPDTVTPDVVAGALETARSKRPLPALDLLRFERFREGTSAQILHVGPYDAEEPTIARLHAFLQREGYQARGAHHEIYLSDPARTAPERLKTIIRQAVRPA